MYLVRKVWPTDSVLLRSSLAGYAWTTDVHMEKRKANRYYSATTASASEPVGRANKTKVQAWLADETSWQAQKPKIEQQEVKDEQWSKWDDDDEADKNRIR